MMAVKGESNSSSSSSLVCDFLSTEDPLLLSSGDLIPVSPIIPATEANGGGKYTIGAALHGNCGTDPSSASS